MSHLIRVFSLLTLPVLTAIEAPAQDVPVPDKSGYTLFNPTPVDLMRDLSADRPDGTESPYTVDAGHFQVEMSFIDYTHNDDSGLDTDTFKVFDTNLKLGLTNNTDLQVIFTPYLNEENKPEGGPAGTVEDFGDIQLRLKVNLWGNDGGETAFGIMPFVKIPTGAEFSNDHVEGGFVTMLAWNVADNWGLGFMAEADAVYDSIDNDYDMEFVHTAALGFDLLDWLGAYVEYIGVVSSDSGTDYDAVFSAGLTYELRTNLVLDIGTRVGLTSAADDLNLFAGMTWRY
jgi:Putative MetA-pathway of phenol degradation